MTLPVQAQEKNSITMTLVGVGLVLAALRVAQEVFVPLAIAILLSLLLAPLVKRLGRWGLPNVAAVMSTVLLAFSVISLVGWLVSAQFINLIDNLPQYQENLRSKIAAAMSSGGGDGILSRAGDTLDVLIAEFENGAQVEPRLDSGGNEPVLVTVQAPAPGPLQTLRQLAAPLLGPIGTAALSLIFVIFILLQRNDLRERFIKLVSGGNLNMATEAVDDAARRITRYLLMHTVINVTYGIPVAAGLYFIGVPNALLWGLLATLLRFIPFIGAWISATFPIALAFAVDPGWTMPLLTIGLFVFLELISNNVLEPWLYGSSTGISAVALIFAALVWTWIWGPVGLFLSTPLTVCLLVIGKNSPSLNFLHVILGTEPVLAPEAHLYQRMLAMDAEGMLESAEQDLALNPSLLSFYDRVLVPALAFAEQDRHAGVLAERRQEFIAQSTRDLLEDLGERHATPVPGSTGPSQVLCIPVKDNADELTALMFVQVLQQAGIPAESVPLGLTKAEILGRLQGPGPSVVCLCAIPPGAMVASRRYCRLLRDPHFPLQVIAGMWGSAISATTLEKRLGSPAPDGVATHFSDALVQVQNMLGVEDSPMVPAPLNADEAERLIEVYRLGILDTPPEYMYDVVTRQLAEKFELPISLVSIVDSDRQFWKSQVGLPQELADAGAGLRSESICGHVVAANQLLVIEDLARDKRFANNPFVKDRGIRFYAGAPLRTSRGHAVGSLCVIDIKPRKINQDQKWLLCFLADQLMKSAEAAAERKLQAALA